MGVTDMALGRWTLLAMMGLCASPAMADELWERRIVLARRPSNHPVTIYGAPGKPLQLSFEIPLGKGAIRAPGVEVRRDPAHDNELVLTPSRALAIRGSLPVVIPLSEGAVTLTLAFKPGTPDTRVVVFRAGEPSQPMANAEPAKPTCAVAAATPIIEMIFSGLGGVLVPDEAAKCRLSLVVRTPDAPEGYAVEIRSADRAFCASRLP